MRRPDERRRRGKATQLFENTLVEQGRDLRVVNLIGKVRELNEGQGVAYRGSTDHRPDLNVGFHPFRKADVHQSHS